MLDSLTSLSYPIIQYLGNEDIVLAFTNYDYSFVLFDYNSGLPVKKIKVDPDKFKGIGKISTSFTYNFYFINYDSIYLFNTDNEKVFLLDSSANIKRFFAVAPKDKNNTHAHTNFGELMQYRNGQLYLDAAPGMNLMHPDRPLKKNLVMTLDLASGKMNYDISFPELYTEAFWGEHLSECYTVYNPNENIFVRSFPIDHNLYVYNQQGQITQHYAGSKYIDHVTPLIFSNGNIKKKQFSETAEIDNYIHQRSYHRIYYDPYTKLYYRFVTNAIPDTKTGISTPFSIIVLDEHFNILVEQEFDNQEYWQVSMFISKEGLCLYRRTANEDELDYDIYRFDYNKK